VYGRAGPEFGRRAPLFGSTLPLELPNFFGLGGAMNETELTFLVLGLIFMFLFFVIPRQGQFPRRNWRNSMNRWLGRDESECNIAY
jgi:hypothetical protein